MKKTSAVQVGMAAIGLLLAQSALSANDSPIVSADVVWLLTASALVLFMTLPGLALFYGGLVRSKNVLSLIIQCFAITSVGSVVWFVLGYSVAFGDGGSAPSIWGGMSKAALHGVTIASTTATVPEYLFFLFQMTFAVITPALVIGAFAERIRFSVVILFSIGWLLLVYAPVAHWVWGGGWLAKMGVMDFAGGIVVHVTAGASALVCALYMGRRRGFPQVSMPPHSLPLTAAGAGMLWVGWFGFNGGSALAANGVAVSAVLCTHLGASAGAIAWMFMEWRKYGKPSVLGLLTGVVAGLGTITPASGFVSPWSALLIGSVAGCICFLATQFIKQRLAIDDSLDVSPVHGVGGVLGSFMTGIFAAPSLGGAGLNGGGGIGYQLLLQAGAVLAVALWCVLVTFGLLWLLNATLGLRVSEEHETEGLDLSSHGERGYIH